MFRFLRANCLHLLHGYFIFDISLIEFTNFSPNTVITLNIMYNNWNYRFLEISRMPSHAEMHTKGLSGAVY